MITSKAMLIGFVLASLAMIWIPVSSPRVTADEVLNAGCRIAIIIAVVGYAIVRAIETRTK